MDSVQDHHRSPKCRFPIAKYSQPLLIVGLPAGAVLERRVEGLVVVPEVADLRGRDHVVAADEAHLVLDVAILVAGVGVAEPRLEAVVQPKPPEQLRLGDDVVPAPPGLGRVVEHDDPRHAAHHVEGVLEPLADADVLRRRTPRTWRRWNTGTTWTGSAS